MESITCSCGLYLRKCNTTPTCFLTHTLVHVQKKKQATDCRWNPLYWSSDRGTLPELPLSCTISMVSLEAIASKSTCNRAEKEKPPEYKILTDTKNIHIGIQINLQDTKGRWFYGQNDLKLPDLTDSSFGLRSTPSKQRQKRAHIRPVLFHLHSFQISRSGKTTFFKNETIHNIKIFLTHSPS